MVKLKRIGCLGVVVNKTNITPPGVERIISGKVLDIGAAPSSAVILTAKKFTQRYYLQMAKSLVSGENTCILNPVLDPSEKYIKMYEKSVAVTCEAMTVDNEITSLDLQSQTAFIKDFGLYQFKVIVKDVLPGLFGKRHYVRRRFRNDITASATSTSFWLENESRKVSFVPEQCFMSWSHWSQRGVQTNPDKIKAVQKWSTTIEIKEARSFIGLCSYYKNFIRIFVVVVKAFDANSDLSSYNFILDNDASSLSISAGLPRSKIDRRRFQPTAAGR
ncbi:hypothetical protein CHS0354_000841 [Potamilus streckersoni]|uniref:Uncharacterized protein n=1 Tax=Potamilus streckersoni TaxID=2493646 RepID=A0AAE0RUW7_9BIVA|nr:hypothetical protein CHS0354_000841 [Potamilus streckersoni]